MMRDPEPQALACAALPLTSARHLASLQASFGALLLGLEGLGFTTQSFVLEEVWVSRPM